MRELTMNEIEEISGGVDAVDVLTAGAAITAVGAAALVFSPLTATAAGLYGLTSAVMAATAAGITYLKAPIQR